jgi:hypothetical protein
VPFLLVGDSPQALIANLSEADAAAYFADRQAHGFNAAWINLLCTTYTACRADGTTFDGIAPFTARLGAGSYNLADPNPAYFARADDMLRLAAQHGIVVFLDPIETGGWLQTLRDNGQAADFAYGQYVGSRYKAVPNVAWLMGNDFQSWGTASDDALVAAVADGIRAAGDTHPVTAELSFFESDTWQDSTWQSRASLDGVYTYSPTYARMLVAYNRNQGPAFLIESNYEGENNTGKDPSAPAILRRQEYWTLLSGATGQLYGNRYTWQFIAGWQSNLDSPGVVQLGYSTALFAPRRWYDLVPDQGHRVVTAGYGTYSDSGSLGGNDYLTAARTPDGSLVIAYLPTPRTITVDMTRLAGPATARWYDPTSGAYSAIAGSPFANSGSQQFTPPGNNSGGDGDWVLVLES